MKQWHFWLQLLFLFGSTNHFVLVIGFPLGNVRQRRRANPSCLYAQPKKNQHFLPYTQTDKACDNSKNNNLWQSTMIGCLFLLIPFSTQYYNSAAVAAERTSIVEETAPTNARMETKKASAYWNMMTDSSSSNNPQIELANEKLLDHAVGTIMMQYYDNSGGTRFNPKDFYDRWKILKLYSKEGANGVQEELQIKQASYRKQTNRKKEAEQQPPSSFIPQLFFVNHDTVEVQKQHEKTQLVPKLTIPPAAFTSRDNAVKSLKWLVSSLEDPYSQYLTRQELSQELSSSKQTGLLGLGAILEEPHAVPPSSVSITGSNDNTKQLQAASEWSKQHKKQAPLLAISKASNLPRVTAIAPDSPAERAGIVVGDCLVGIGKDSFLGLGRDEIASRLQVYTGAENYIGTTPDLTLAQPVVLSDHEYGIEELIGYKVAHVRLTTTSSLDPFTPYKGNQQPLTTSSTKDDGNNYPQQQMVSLTSSLSSRSRSSEKTSATTLTYPTSTILSGGDSIVHWELLTPNDSIFFQNYANSNNKIGYIRLTRFSRLSTAGYVQAIQALEDAGAQSYIFDLRNNYGGIIQESMLTASTLLRDPHAVLCYTLNSRGGFTPHDVEEYVVDKRYPGYFLSKQSNKKFVTQEQVKKEHPEYYQPVANMKSNNGRRNWVPPSSYASIHELRMKRNYKRPSQLNSQEDKPLVLLINEGTASSAEVFGSALRDNGRTIALVGTKTYGKGLIQHTFPMPDGGGLRLTVAEYLTPLLKHVTQVGRSSQNSGIRPDVYCPSTQGIPQNIGADICVGMALDVLDSSSDTDHTTI
mmetsp:Transcript_25961/g.39292  ORF Transcript_25961/g.39292 Transcript_25961/m.39292 type:complete len:808 (-) Transcript_25961:323-2746(-)|eukprot:CAMPEP_0178897810 /NCGR_PEP_ID=MMETSP0786-20121207/1965_1 /TAXON_ID=186022 /ORGANISM="Thalassionema frauenfeldii, Strain CCMP 1798" /LENGTH=807 /DNA_ID=CAMNT_0020568425 /DNA_START=83 /DNA_END=2506 /DNA_ORIENTATION=+